VLNRDYGEDDREQSTPLLQLPPCAQTGVRSGVVMKKKKKGLIHPPVWPNTSNSSFLTPLVLNMGTAVAQWLRCCATNRKVADSIPDAVIGILG